jgi:hypothetical protein
MNPASQLERQMREMSRQEIISTLHLAVKDGIENISTENLNTDFRQSTKESVKEMAEGSINERKGREWGKKKVTADSNAAGSLESVG